MLTGADLLLVQDIRDRLRLTASRHRMLSDLARSYKLHTGSDLPDLTRFTHVSVHTRQEGDVHFERLWGILSVE